MDEHRSPTDPQQSAWAAPVDRLRVSDLPSGAINLNVDGRRLSGPVHGFGQLWQKTYRVRLKGSSFTPAQAIQLWKENFPKFWPKGNRFYGSLAPIAPGDIAVLNLAGPGGITALGGAPLISTGIMVIYADEESFSFMTPEGHIFAGMITFSAFEDEGDTVCQVQALVRANDPIYEMSFRLGFGHQAEDEFWRQTLQNLAAFLHADVRAEQSVICIDRKVQWKEIGNIWHNAAIRTGVYIVMGPLRWIRSRIGSPNKDF